ncbi:hypothetical protein C1645_825876 [Glomus cerebriforme]|uniref:Uncharacterized protein n=1 Tax=Glomus cerebriforme TaxID=658196 RepID=A0A397SVU1_9GLOM|nr:hypothetical protein C1645_825876 [Glomus cerebriforme]
MSGQTVTIILDKIYNKSVLKPTSLRSEYDIEYRVTKTCYNHWAGRKLPISYHRPSVHKSQMAICFKCWKLVKITKVKLRKEYFNGWHRWVYEIKSEDLIKDHWNNSCFKAETATIVKNTIPSAPNFKPACISPARTTLGNLAEAYFDSV